MGLLDDVKAAKAATTTTKCSVCAWLATKPEPFRVEVAEVLATREETNTICAVLTEKHGFTRSATTLGRHRRVCSS